MITRIFRRIFTAESMGAILVLVALQIMVYGVSTSLRSTDTTGFYYACLISVVISYRLGRKKCGGMQASAWMAALGVIGVWIIGAGLATPLLTLGRVTVSVILQNISFTQSQTPVDTTPIIDAWMPLARSSSALWARIQAWWLGFHRGVTVNDALIRNMIWLLILWFVSAWIGWFARRRNAILALMPGLLLLAAVASYSERKVETVWLMVVVLLLLMGLWNYRNNSSHWEKQKIDYSESILIDVTQAVVFLSMLIASLAFITPSISWQEIRDYLRERDQTSENDAAEMLGIQQPAGPSKSTPAQPPPLPREHLLGGGFATSQKIVMVVKTGELPPIPDYMEGSLTIPRYYWRSVTYDKYTGVGWESHATSPQAIRADTPLVPGLLTGYKLVHMDVEFAQPEGKLFWSGILFSADVPITVDWRLRPQSNLFADQTALLQADMFSVSTKATAYKADSYVPIVTVNELRDASTEYPDHIIERYLALPRTIPDRVRALAEEVTQNIENPYDKAAAIETYLRTNYPYDLEIPAPPKDRDVTDHFLFELRKGYCDYYATALVVLARYTGLPARLVSGYSSGTYDVSRAQYVVREMHAHSWVEVYFPEIGWVEFEPTASEPEIVRAEPDELAVVMNEPVSPVRKLLARLQPGGTFYWVLLLFSVIALLSIYFAFIERWLCLRLAPVHAIERLYRRFYRLGRPLAGERTRAETAHEFADKVSGRVHALSGNSRFEGLLSHLQDDVIALTNSYQQTLFSEYRARKKDAHSAWRTWRCLRLRLWVARILLLVAKR